MIVQKLNDYFNEKNNRGYDKTIKLFTEVNPRDLKKIYVRLTN